MKEGRILFISFLMCIASGSVFYWMAERQHKKIAVVDAVKLFDQFNMKKEMEAREKTKLELLNKRVDSITTELQLAKASQNEDAIKRLSYTYNYIKGSMENEFKQSNRDINEQVWKRLNPALDEYGRKHNLHLIIGANGMGSVLYNDEYYDLTSELIKFVNKKYEEGN